MFLVLMALSFTLRLVELAVIGHVIGSWLQWNRENRFVRALAAVAEPLLKAVRPLARHIPGPFDWSPMIVLVGLHVLRTLVGG
jgi:uncharacterized protein YggT (Ycf19 family)